MFCNAVNHIQAIFCAFSGPEATMYVSSGSTRRVHPRCASQRCCYCAGCVSGGIRLTGGWWLLNLFLTQWVYFIVTLNVRSLGCHGSKWIIW